MFKRMSTNERDFKGVWIPREIYLAKDLSWAEKILLIEIDSLDKDPKRGCFASNQFLAEFLGQSAGSVANMISKLREAGYIKQLFYDGKNRGLRSNFHSQTPKAKTSKNLHKNVKHKLHKIMNDASQNYEAYASQIYEHTNTELVIQENLTHNADARETEVSTPEPEAKEWGWPMKPLVDAFPDYLPDRITPALIGFIEADVGPGDEEAWRLTIETYRMNFDPGLNRYLPDKTANILSVFRKNKAAIDGEKYGNNAKSNTGRRNGGNADGQSTSEFLASIGARPLV